MGKFMKKFFDINNQLNNDKKVPLKPFWCFKYLIKKEILIVLLICIIFILCNIFPKNLKLTIRYNINNVFYSNTNNGINEFEKIENSINENKYLKNEEKNFITSKIKDEYTENFNYINSKNVSKNLKNLKISYDISDEKRLGGEYNLFSDEIIFYNSEENMDYYDKILFHELNHVFTNYNFNSKSKVLTEITNEMFTIEYLDSNIPVDIGAYEKYMPYIYLLSELIPTEKIKEYQYSNNENILISELLNIDNNIEKAYDLIDGINTINTKNSLNKTYDAYSYFYEKKYNSSVLNNMAILAYIYNTDIQNNLVKKTFEEFIGSNNIIKITPKGYISQKYKSEKSKIIVEYVKNGKTDYIEI